MHKAAQQVLQKSSVLTCLRITEYNWRNIKRWFSNHKLFNVTQQRNTGQRLTINRLNDQK